MPTISHADALAASAHAGQTDKDGHPHIDHPRAVAEALLPWGDNAVMAGPLRNVVEDTTWDPAEGDPGVVRGPGGTLRSGACTVGEVAG